MKQELQNLKENESPWRELTMIQYPRKKQQIAQIMLEKIQEMEESLYLANWYLHRKVAIVFFLSSFIIGNRYCRQPPIKDGERFQRSFCQELRIYEN